MKIIKRFFLALIVIAILGITGLYATGNGFLVTATQRTYLAGNITANINDHNQFEVRTITKSGTVSALPKHPEFGNKQLPSGFLAELQEIGAAAFLVIKDGQVISEQYMNGYHDRSKTNSFSMAKTLTTLLLGVAIEEGHVESLEQPITDFLPEFKDDPLGSKATVGQLSLMTSGYEWVEHYYTPFSPTVELLYGGDVTEFLLDGEFSAEPGTFWEYSSASTQLMGIFLIRALQRAGVADSLSDYLSKKIWQPLQMNDDALWHLDDSGMELVFCCLNTNARNYAKLGLLMMNSGNWQEQQVVPADFVREMTKPAGQAHYGLSTWLSYDSNPNYYWFSGHLGQFIVNVPDHNMVVIRLGEKIDPSKTLNQTLQGYIDAALTLTE